MNLQGFLSEELWLFILLAIILALAAPGVGQQVTPYSIYALMAVMFFTSINITLGDIKRASKEKGALLTMLLMAFLMGPLVGLGFSTLLGAEMGIGLILYSATPVAMATTFFMKKLKKDTPLALVLTAITTLLSVLLTPLIVGILTSLVIPINPLDLLATLVKVVVIPFGAAAIVRHECKNNAVCSIQTWGAPINTIAFFVVVFGVVSAAEGQIWGLGKLALICMGLLGSLFTIGYVLSPGKRFELGYASAFRNGTLTMVLALEAMGPTAALPAVMITLLHNMMMVPIMFWGKKN